MAFITHSVYPGLTPLFDVTTLPFLSYSSAKQSGGIAWKLYEKYPSMRNEFKTVKLLVPFTTSINYLETSKRQVKTLEDMKGLKLRTVAGPQMDAMKAMGVSPVMMSQADVYQNIDKGVVDGSVSNWAATYPFRTYEVAKYHNNASFGASFMSQIMNIEKYNSLPKDVQDAITGKSGLYGSEFWGYNMFDRLADEAITYIKKEGITIVEYNPTAGELQRFGDVAGKPVWDKWLKDNKAAGRTDAQEILNTLFDLIKTYKPS
jgi:TRAP-type transport system periplasmic protein